jgi:antitoxin (DNA-binding transcriptional repressor) of toxin-antitoxin stability system
MALVMRGESVAIVDGGKEVARLMPPAAGEDWRKARLAELEETFPEPVIVVGA